MPTMLLSLMSAVSLTALAKGPATLLNVTPFEGGRRRNAILDMDAAPAGGGVITIEGSTNDIHTTPGASDPSWTTVATLNASSPLEQEIQLPQWIRYNITTVGTGTANVRLNGVQ